MARGQCWELMLYLMLDGFVLSVFLSPPSAWSRGKVSLFLEPEEREGAASPGSGGDSRVMGFTWFSGWPICLEQNTFTNVSVSAVLR